VASFRRRSSSQWISRRAADGRLGMRAGMAMDEHEGDGEWMDGAELWGR
jgi:hypothetical protein